MSRAVGLCTGSIWIRRIYGQRRGGGRGKIRGKACRFEIPGAILLPSLPPFLLRCEVIMHLTHLLKEEPYHPSAGKLRKVVYDSLWDKLKLHVQFVNQVDLAMRRRQDLELQARRKGGREGRRERGVRCVSPSPLQCVREEVSG